MIPLGLLKRAENEELPLLGIRAIRELRSVLDRLERKHIMSARDKGASWADIAASVGITRQALQQRMRATTLEAEPVPPKGEDGAASRANRADSGAPSEAG